METWETEALRKGGGGGGYIVPLTSDGSALPWWNLDLFERKSHVSSPKEADRNRRQPRGSCSSTRSSCLVGHGCCANALLDIADADSCMPSGATQKRLGLIHVAAAGLAGLSHIPLRRTGVGPHAQDHAQGLGRTALWVDLRQGPVMQACSPISPISPISPSSLDKICGSRHRRPRSRAVQRRHAQLQPRTDGARCRQRCLTSS